eukprot:3585438-Amphidinium_carterae.2
MVSIESLKCLFDSSIPGANEVQATLLAQCPEVYDQYMNFVDEMKTQMREQVKPELESEKEQKSDVNKSSRYEFSVPLSPGDSVSITVKKAKTHSSAGHWLAIDSPLANVGGVQ